MGDAYKGLTIRIGADTSKLQQAMRNAGKVIQTTQGQLNRLKRAAKLDGGSLNSVTTSMNILNNKAAATASQMFLIKRAMQQAERSNPGIAETARNVGDVVTQARMATGQFNRLNAEIAKTKKEAYQAAKGTAWDDMLFFDGENATKAYKEAVADARVHATGDLKAIIDKWDELVAQQKVAQSSIEEYEAAMQYGDAKVALIEYTAKLRQQAQEYRNLIDLQRQFGRSNDIEVIDEKVDAATSSLKRMETELESVNKLLRLNPGDLDAASQRILLMGDRVRNLGSQVELMRDKLNMLDGSKVKELEERFGTVENAVRQTGAALEQAKVHLDTASGGAMTLKQELADLEKECEKDAGKVIEDGVTVEQAIERTTDKLREQEAKVVQLTAELRKAEEAYDGAQAASEFQQTEGAVESLERELKVAKSQVDNLHTSFQRAIGSVKQLGWVLMSTVTPAMQMVLQYAVQAADDIDSAYRDMRKTVEGTDDQFEQLRDSAIKFSQTHVTSADQVLEIMSLGGQMGLAVDQLDSFAETVANLDVATNIDAPTAAEELGQLANILGLTTDEYASFGDALVRLGNNMPAQEDKIMNVEGRIASMSAVLGMTKSDTLAWSSAIAATGQGAEAAGTAISKTMSNLETAFAGGGDSAKAFADVVRQSARWNGKSVDQIVAAWEGGGDGVTEVMRGFIEGLLAIEKSGGSADATLEELGIGSVRQKQAIEGLMTTIGTLDDALLMSSDAWNGVSDEWGAAGDAAREAQRKAEGFSGSLQILKNNVQVFLAELADGLTPFVKGLGKAMEKANEAVGKMTDGQKTATVAIAALVSALGPALVVTAGLIETMKPLKEAYGKFKAALNNVSRGLIVHDEMLRTVVNTSEEARVASQNLTKAQRAQKVATYAAGSALKFLGVALAELALVVVIDAIIKYVDKAKDFEAATKGLADATKSLTDEFTYEDEAVNTMASSYQELRQRIDDTTKAQADTAEKIKEAGQEADTSYAMLKHYTDIIRRIGTDGTDSASELADLKLAVDGINKITGDTTLTIDEMTGAVNMSTSEIEAMTEAWYDNAQAMAAAEAVQELLKENMEYETELNQLNDELDALEKKGSTKLGSGDRSLGVSQGDLDDAYESQVANIQEQIDKTTELRDENQKSIDFLKGKYEEYSAAVGDATAATAELAGGTGDYAYVVDETTGEVVALEEELTGLEKAVGEVDTAIGGITQSDLAMIANPEPWMNLKAAFEENGKSFEDFQAQLDTYGATTESLGNLNDETFAAIRDTYDGTFASIAAILDEAGVELDGFEADQQDALVAASQAWYSLPEATRQAIETAGLDADQFVLKLEELGISASEFANLSNEELIGLVTGTMEYVNGTVVSMSEIESAYGRVTDAAITMGSNTRVGLVASQGGIDAFVQSLLNSGITIEEIVGASGEQLNTWADAWLQANGSAATSAEGVANSAEGASASVQSSSDSMESEWDSSISSMKSTASDYSDYMPMKISNGMARGTQAISDGGSNMSTAAYDAVSGAVDSAAAATSGAYDVGYSISQGIAAGINAGAHLVNSAARSTARGGVNAAADEIKKGSPSKVTNWEIGQPFSQGIAVGIRKAAPLVDKAAVDTMNKAVSAASASIGAFDFPGMASDYAHLGADASTKTTVWNVSINGNVNDSDEIVEVTYDYLMYLHRKAGMNVG